jgi:hypothetical protein
MFSETLFYEKLDVIIMDVKANKIVNFSQLNKISNITCHGIQQNVSKTYTQEKMWKQNIEKFD